MENKNTGYATKHYSFPTKRYCQTLDLQNDAEMIEKYKKCHSQAEHWPVIREGIRKVGILEMEIFVLNNHLFMIVETPMDFEWDSAMAELAKQPLQAEWEEFVAAFQCAEKGAKSNEKWQLMDRMFYLYE